ESPQQGARRRSRRGRGALASDHAARPHGHRRRDRGDGAVPRLRPVVLRDRDRPADRRRQGRDMTRRLAGKVAVVTGAARGIGRAVATAFAAEGAAVHALDRLGDEVVTVARDIGASAWDTDITSADAVERTFAAIHARAESVDILVNNAGIIF